MSIEQSIFITSLYVTWFYGTYVMTNYTMRNNDSSLQIVQPIRF
jgi:hypothetical protein